MHLYDVIIVGAGISGCFTAANLSHKGLNVLLIDKNLNHCHGEKLWIAEKRALELLDSYAQECTVTDVSDISIKNLENKLSFRFKKPGLYLLKAGKLCSNLYSSCRENNITIRENEHVIDIKIQDYYVEVRTNCELYRSKYLVGADGVNSVVGRKAGINTGQHYCIGIEALYKTDEFIGKGMEVDLSSIPYGFSMALNYDGMLLLYAASFYGGKVDIKKYFGNYVSSMGLKNDTAYYTRGNLIPYSNGARQNYVNKRVMLIGGAARLSNPLTTSVLYYAVKSSMICSGIILEKINHNEENTNGLTKFNQEVDCELLREIRELYPISRLVYNNRGFFFKVIKHAPYMAKHFAALLCGRMDGAEKGLLSLVLPWKGKSSIRDIGIIK